MTRKKIERELLLYIKSNKLGNWEKINEKTIECILFGSKNGFAPFEVAYLIEFAEERFNMKFDELFYENIENFSIQKISAYIWNVKG